MNKDLALSATVFGFGTRIFFIGYFIFEVPSNVILEKVGARLWIARIMLTWGLASAATAFVWNDISFYVMRFLLGAAEAGFIPGAYYYLTFWAPSRHRSKLVALVAVMGSVTGAISGVVSGWILDAFAGTWGLAGWQWLFLLEATPSIVMAFAVFARLPDSPARATDRGAARAASASCSPPLRADRGSRTGSIFRSRAGKPEFSRSASSIHPNASP